MGLTFGALTSDLVNHGQSTAIDDLTTWTTIMWVYPTTFTTGRSLFAKIDTLTPFATRRITQFATAGELRVSVQITGGSVDYRTNSTAMALNTHCFIAATFDIGGSAGEMINVYSGRLNALATECTYGTATDQTGTLIADNAVDLTVGNTIVAIGAFEGSINVCGHWNRVLTLAEIQQQQFHPHPTSGCVLFTHYGLMGTGTQPDWSGNANVGTVTGATVSSHVPLGPLFSFATDISYKTATVAGSTDLMAQICL